MKAEHNAFGANPRFVVANLAHADRHVYDRLYCARGDRENRIKDKQLDLFAGRASCTGSGRTSSGNCCRRWPTP